MNERLGLRTALLVALLLAFALRLYRLDYQVLGYDPAGL